MSFSERTDIDSAPLHRSTLYRCLHRSLSTVHTYLLGQDPTKLVLLEQYALDAIRNGDGVVFLDAHGHSIDRLIHYIPRQRRKDVIVFDPSREEVCGFNPLDECSPLAVSVLMDTVKEAWGYGEMPTPQMDMYLFFSLMVLAENKKTLTDFPPMLTDKSFRDTLTMSDSVVRDFWDNFDHMTPKEQRDQVASTLNKALMLIADERVRKALSFSSFRLADSVNDKILFIRLPHLSKGRTSLLGSVFLSLIAQAVLDRDNTTPLHLFVPNVHLYTKDALKELLVSGEAYNLSLTLSHEYIAQLDPDLYAAIIANCTDQLTFRLSQDDAKRLVDRMGRWRPDIFTDLMEGRYRKYPVMNGSDISVEIKSQPPYPRSEADILEHHRRHLWK